MSNKQNINIELIIGGHALDREAVAKALFPENAHPRRALTRTIKERRPLNEHQLAALARLMRVAVVDLFEDGRTGAAPILSDWVLEYKAENQAATLTTGSGKSKNLVIINPDKVVALASAVARAIQ